VIRYVTKREEKVYKGMSNKYVTLLSISGDILVLFGQWYKEWQL